ncbi:hypothetical protein G7054_g11630 [Neopestalotiopsis clavispora]|nr:hypothetical protein G7054_g11630 [Neopestalotiopsis clavispora]
MSPLGSRSLLRGAVQLSSTFSRRSISSFNKTPPAANKGPNSGSEQAHPIGAYYEAIIVTPQPIPEVKPEEPPTSSPKSPRSTAKKTAAARKNPPSEIQRGAAPSPSTEPATAQEKARIIFGSRLVGPIERQERLQAIKDESTMIAGVRVPPKPEEPDNCCMSGCVNCVWDRYRDEMEDWVSSSKEAERRLQAERAQGPIDTSSSESAVEKEEDLKEPASEPVTSGHAQPGLSVDEAVSMDDDGGGSDTNWPTPQPKIAKDLWDDGLYKNIPVGIREFMKTEKKLKQRHEEEGSVGG